MYGSYNNPYSSITPQLTQVQQAQQQQYMLSEFLKTERGQKAHDKFVAEQKLWWEEVNGIAPKKNESSEKISEMEEKIDKVSNLVSSLVEQLGATNDK